MLGDVVCICLQMLIGMGKTELWVSWLACQTENALFCTALLLSYTFAQPDIWILICVPPKGVGMCRIMLDHPVENLGVM